MPDAEPPERYRFGIFELDATAGELRRNGLRVKVHSQPLQLLRLLLDRPNEVLTREEICRQLWPDGTFVDYEHGVNSAVNRLREALGDKASNPRFIETEARRGYRFVGAVERIGKELQPPAAEAKPLPPPPLHSVLADPEDLPKTSQPVVQTLFVLLQLMYLSFYIAALANLPRIAELLSMLSFSTGIFTALIVTAALLIPVRTFLLSAALLRAPGIPEKFRKLFPFLLPLDALWSLAPFLLIDHIGFGLALACTTLLVYSPFAQRSLVLMGAPRTEYGKA